MYERFQEYKRLLCTKDFRNAKDFYVRKTSEVQKTFQDTKALRIRKNT